MKRALLILLLLNVYLITVMSITYMYSNITTEKIVLLLPQIIIIFYLAYMKRVKNGPLIDLLNISIFIRYLIIPILIVIFDKNYQIENFYHSFYIYIYELICVIFTIIFSIQKKVNLEEKSLDLKRKDFLLLLLLIGTVIIVLINPNLIKQYNFIFLNKKVLERISFSSKLDILLIWSRYIFIYVVTKFYYQKFLKTKSNIYYILNMFFLILNMLIIRGTSRFSIMIFLYLLFVITKYIYKKEKYVYVILGLGGIILSYSTFLKFSKGESINFNEFFSIFILNIRNNLEIYFGGLKNISLIDNLLKIQESTNKFTLFFNDTFSSVMFLSKFTNFENTTIVNFNYVIYNHKDYQDQIVPLSLQSYSYLGSILFPLLAIIYTNILVRLDNFFFKTKRLDYSYLIILIGFIIGNFMMTNHTIVFSGIVNLFPLLIIFLLNNKINTINIKKNNN